jgi:hypothetical protein
LFVEGFFMFGRRERWRCEDDPDIGIDAINRVYRLWQVDERWSVREERAFSWWAGDFRQRVYVDNGRKDHEAHVYKLSAVTEVLKEVDPGAPDTATQIAALNTFSASHALVLDESARRATLTCSVLFHMESADWVVPLFAALAITQLIDAQARAEVYAEMFSAVPNKSHHPLSGVRADHDEILGTIAQVYLPAGQEASRWITSGEFEELLPLLRHGNLFANGDRSGFTAEMAFGKDTALIRATGSELHRQFGTGLRLSLALPVALSEQAAVSLSLQLNAAEASSFTRSLFMGAWSVKEARGGYVPDFVSFIPNALYRPGLLFNLILSLGLKARWARSEIAPYAEDQQLARVLSRRFRVRGEE